MELRKALDRFFQNEKASGATLVVATLISLAFANSPWRITYFHFWHLEISGQGISHWINDGLMAIFFLLVGLELKREILQGELASLKKASLPVAGALGGMLIPAGIYTLFNIGTETQSGAGIPMATDIAFAVGILSLLGSRVPTSLKIFLMALAVIDDLGAIFVIAVFYTSALSLTNLFLALGIFGLLLILNRLKVRHLLPYLIGGVAMWYFMLHSGIHATLAGVLLAIAIPFEDGRKKSASFRLQHFLHLPVSFLILPLFAMANTCIEVGNQWQQGLGEPSSLGILVGLVIGKPLGIWLFSVIGVRAGICTLPPDLKWKNILGAGFIGGIGFTMSIFITLLAFNNSQAIDHAKIAILIASLLAGIIGFLFLYQTLKSPIGNNKGT